MKDIKKIKKIIQDLVNKIDPWYLIEMEAPYDEYDVQVNRIVSFLVYFKPNQFILEGELRSLFHTKEFELEEEKVIELAKKILSQLK